MSALSEDRSTSPAVTVGGGLVVALAGAMITAAVIIGLVVETDWTVITRLLVTAVVYARPRRIRSCARRGRRLDPHRGVRLAALDR
ncbi:hypothetical protein [Microbacterium aurantiacum]|uniref:hypothetical protein n=1 Tax=Microbacterium aurantiacum TaxID=162393 RepID=UPI003F490D93